MHFLTIGDQSIQISEHDFFNLINHLVKGYLVLAKAYHSYHESGFADIKGSLYLLEVAQNEYANALVNQIDDNELFAAFNSFKAQLKELQEIDTLITQWLGRYVGLTSLENKEEKSLLKRRLKKVVRSGYEGRPGGPIWVLSPDYQVLVKHSESILANLQHIQKTIEKRIQQLDEDQLNMDGRKDK